MFYSMCFMTFICAFNLLVMALFVWKFGKGAVHELFFVNDEEVKENIPLDRTQKPF